MKDDIYFMQEALKEANSALLLDEVPIGCVITVNDQIISRACNRRNTDKNSTSHAEILAIKDACEKVGDWRLEECTIYITLEPCPMCAGAIVQARIKKVVFGASSAKAGCGGSLINLLERDDFNHKCIVERGVLEKPCSLILSNYFRQIRKLRSVENG